MRFAIVNADGLVVSILSASTVEDLALNIPDGAAAHPCDDLTVLPGTHRYDAEKGTFISIAVVEQPTPSPPLTRLAYQRRYSQAERIAIRASADPIVIDFSQLALLAEEIDLADPDVIDGTRYLEHLGLIGAGRAAEILDAAR